jgi:hypothetical protein
MRNVHIRRLSAPIERVGPWIETCWTGGVLDCFPRDVIPSWRRNPPGADPLALIAGETLIGHGPFRFRLREWDGRVWRVDVVGGLTGWHGFDLAPDGEGCRLTHTLELEESLAMRLGWMPIAPIHDWAVEALFDRLEHALATGAPPARTERRMSPAVSLALAFAGRRKRIESQLLSRGR